MKIRIIVTAATTGIPLTAAGSSLAWGVGQICPRGYAGCVDYKCYRSYEYGNCEGRWSGDGDWICPDRNHGQTSLPDTSEYRYHGGNNPHGRRGCGSHYRWKNGTVPGNTGYMERLCGRG